MLEANDRGVEGFGNMEGLNLLSGLEAGLERIVSYPPQAGSRAEPQLKTGFDAF